MELLNISGYYGSIETSVADNVLHGKVMFISDLVTYEAETLGELKQEFEAAVTDYLATCKSVGKKPEKSLSGQFNVRTGEELHRKAQILALSSGKSLNAVMVEALEAHLSGGAPVHNHIHSHEHVLKVVAIERSELRWSSTNDAMPNIPSYLYDTTNTTH
ncbi:MAG: type II toxin-antitoxin system HicB family antitoxin [Anaerolineales bacterium]|nr:type II toxin-antitoxin system HicB family antitoxin [Anaerolineales bacterium]